MSIKQPKIWWHIPRYQSGEHENVRLAFKIAIYDDPLWIYLPENLPYENYAQPPYYISIDSNNSEYWQDIHELCTNIQNEIRSKIASDPNCPAGTEEHFFCEYDANGFVSFRTDYGYGIKLFWADSLIKGKTVGAVLGFDTTQNSDWSMPHSGVLTGIRRHDCGVYRSASGANLGASEDSGEIYTEALITEATTYSGNVIADKFGHKIAREIEWQFIGEEELEQLREFWCYASQGGEFAYFEDSSELRAGIHCWVLDRQSREKFAPTRMYAGIPFWRWRFRMLRRTEQ